MQGSPYPGSRTTVFGAAGATYPYPSFNSAYVRGLPAEPSPLLQGKRAAMQTRESLARSMGLTFPPNKRPRGTPNPNPPATTGALFAGAGRGIATSFISNPAASAAQEIAGWQPGDVSNDFLSVQRFVETGKGELEFAQFLKGHIVFNHKAMFVDDTQPNQLRMQHPLTGGYYGVGRGFGVRPQGSYRLMSLPVLNYYLRLDDYYRPGSAHPWLTPAQVLQQYSLDGVVRTDAHESKSSAYRNVQTKIYTISIGGREPDAINVWGAVAQQQPLYLLCTRIPRDRAPAEYYTNANSDMSHRVPPPKDGGLYHPNPLQIIPWTSATKREPTLEDLKYFDEADRVHRYGIALRVGWANYPSTASNTESVDQAWYNATTMTDLPSVDIHINTRSKGGDPCA